MLLSNASPDELIGELIRRETFAGIVLTVHLGASSGRDAIVPHISPSIDLRRGIGILHTSADRMAGANRGGDPSAR